MTTIVLGSTSPGARDRRAEPHLRVVPAAPRRTARPAARRAPLRLTRRGRFAVRFAVVVLAVLATAAVVLAGGRAARADGAAHVVPVEYHVVLPGESLWQIAGEVAPGADRRDTVARIVELNALQSGVVQAGTRIAVPASG